MQRGGGDVEARDVPADLAQAGGVAVGRQHAQAPLALLRVHVDDAPLPEQSQAVADRVD